VYPSPPVVLVALEIRHPSTGPLSRGAIAGIKRVLGKQLPLLRETALMSVNVQAGGPEVAPEVTTETSPKFFSRDSATAVTFQRHAIVVETTKYSQYERLRDLVTLAVEARQSVEPVDGVDRVGLRYIDEIRVPDTGTAPMDWEPWIDASLLGPAPLGRELALAPTHLQGLCVFQPAPGKSLVLRYGPRQGYAVDPGGDLKRTTTSPGPYFLLDIDSFWMAPEDTPELDLKWLLSLCDDLHEPVGDLFERLITERLREEVLRYE
jgi:uncharacterized protein (TIGR04255 family)